MPTQREKSFYFDHGFDWTVDPKTHRANSSEKYNSIVAAVDEIIRDEARNLINGRSESVARSIVSSLAYTHGLAPVEETKTANLTLRHGLAPSKDTKKNKKTD